MRRAAAAQALPHRFILSDDLLERNGIEGAKREELMHSNATFLSVLPRSILNMEIARRGLGPDPTSASREHMLAHQRNVCSSAGGPMM